MTTKGVVEKVKECFAPKVVGLPAGTRIPDKARIIIWEKDKEIEIVSAIAEGKKCNFITEKGNATAFLKRFIKEHCKENTRFVIEEVSNDI